MFGVAELAEGDLDQAEKSTTPYYLPLPNLWYQVSLLLTPHHLDGIGPRDRLPANSLPCERSLGITTLDTRVLSVEVKDHIGVPISIHILQGRMHRSSFSPRCTKKNRCRSHGGAIKSSVVKMATGITPLLLGLILLGKLPGLMSMATVISGGARVYHRALGHFARSRCRSLQNPKVQKGV